MQIIGKARQSTLPVLHGKRQSERNFSNRYL